MRFAALRARLAVGRRSSTIFFSAKSDRLAACASSLQSKPRPGSNTCALGEAALSRRGAHRVGRLQREQRLVAVHA
jgi:hypothetical protein